MKSEDIELLEEMYANAILAKNGNGEYVDPKAADKAEVLKKVLDMVREPKDEEIGICDERFTYTTTNRRDFKIILNSWEMLSTLYDFICLSRAIYNGKDYGKGSVICRGKLYTADEWDKFRRDNEIAYNWEERVYIDTHGRIPADEVHFVYTRDQVMEEIDNILEDVKGFVYDVME